MIHARGLTKQFGDLVAVDRLSLDVESGEVFGFLGPNGAGKTTTIRMLTGLIAPSAGRATVAGYDVAKEGYELRKRVGILTESPGLYDRLSAAKNLSFFAEMSEVEDVSGKVERYLRMLGLWDRRNDEAGAFSKGMRQKLAIARALLHEPQVLFLDEPTSGLDPEAAHLVREFIAGLKAEGRTIFLCTHNLNEADRLCDRIAVFNSSLVAVDRPAALRTQLYDRIVVFHLREVERHFERVVREHPGVSSVETMDAKLVVRMDEPERINPELIRALVEAGADLQFVGEVRHSLEDVYLHLIGDKGDSPEEKAGDADA